MKIAVRGGHNYKATGAKALIDEVTEDRKVKDSVIKYLKQLGHNVLDVTPGDMDSRSDLVYGVNKANNWGADLFISIHFNNAYCSYKGALGTEVCVYNNFDIANRIVNNLAALGFKNRGQKVRTNLYELKNTKCKAVIVECCFVEATKDVEIYKTIGYDTVGKAIAEGISGKVINKPTNNIVTTKLDKKAIEQQLYSVTCSLNSIASKTKDNKDILQNIKSLQDIIQYVKTHN